MKTVARRLADLESILTLSSASVTSTSSASVKQAVAAAAAAGGNATGKAEVDAVKETQGAVALEQIATDVLRSGNPVRLEALSALAKEHLIEFELAIYVSDEVLRLRMDASAATPVETAAAADAAGAASTGGAADPYDTPEVQLASAKYNKACILSDCGDHESAYAMYEEARTIYTATLGPESLEVGRTLNNMCAIRIFQRKFEDAKDLCTRALSIQETILGPDNLLVGQVTSNLGTVMLALGRLDDALELFERAKVIQSAVSGADDPDVGGAINNIAMVLFIFFCFFGGG